MNSLIEKLQNKCQNALFKDIYYLNRIDCNLKNQFDLHGKLEHFQKT